MRIWDLPAGYLSRQRLLGEHRELHGIHSIITNRKAGYARHPETERWRDALSGLAQRHEILAAEMRLRGYLDRTPVPCGPVARWPRTFVTDPAGQAVLLMQKYLGKEAGRIPLPATAQALWAQHKYSVLARDAALARRFGRLVSRSRRPAAPDVWLDLVIVLRECPSPGGRATAVEHMWGHVRRRATAAERTCAASSLRNMLGLTQTLAVRWREPVLMASTALSELDAFDPRAGRDQ